MYFGRDMPPKTLKKKVRIMVIIRATSFSWFHSCHELIVRSMHEIHAFLSLDKQGGKYYMDGQSLLPTKSATSSSAVSHIF